MGRGENPEGGALGLSSARRRTPQHAEGGARTEEMRRLHGTLLTSREILSLAHRLHYDRMPHELAREDYRELKDQFLIRPVARARPAHAGARRRRPAR